MTTFLIHQGVRPSVIGAFGGSSAAVLTVKYVPRRWCVLNPNVTDDGASLTFCPAGRRGGLGTTGDRAPQRGGGCCWRPVAAQLRWRPPPAPLRAENRADLLGFARRPCLLRPRARLGLVPLSPNR